MASTQLSTDKLEQWVVIDDYNNVRAIDRAVKLLHEVWINKTSTKTPNQILVETAKKTVETAWEAFSSQENQIQEDLSLFALQLTQIVNPPIDALFKKITQSYNDENHCPPRSCVLIPREIPIFPSKELSSNREQQTKFIQRVVSLFAKDYALFLPPNDPHLAYIQQEHLFRNSSSHFTQLASFIGFPQASSLEETHKNLLIQVLSGVSHFFGHYSEATNLLKNSNSINSYEADETVILAHIYSLRQQQNKPSIFTPGMTEVEKKSKFVVNLECFIRENKPKVEGINNLTIEFFLPFICSHIASFFYTTLSKESILTILYRFFVDQVKIEEMEEGEGIEEIGIQDKEFSKQIGKLISNIALQILTLCEARGITSAGLGPIKSWLSDNSTNIGDIVQKLLIKSLKSKSRLRLFLVFSKLFWLQSTDDWLPYLKDETYRKNAVANEGKIKEKFSEFVINEIMKFINPPKEKTPSAARRLFGGIAKNVVNVEGSLPKYAKELTQTFYKILQQRDITLTCLVYVLESLKNKKNSNT